MMEIVGLGEGNVEGEERIWDEWEIWEMWDVWGMM